MKLINRLKKERTQALEHAKKYILKKDKSFRDYEKNTKKVKPIRHPNGKEYKGADYAFFWSDAIWCGDVHLETLELYLGVAEEGEELVDLLENEYEGVDYYTTKIWNQALKEVLPQVYWCELGCELDDKPTNPQEEIWFKIASGEIEGRQ